MYGYWCVLLKVINFIMPPGKDKVHDHYHTREETYMGMKNGSKVKKKRVFKKCLFCSFEWVFENVDQLRSHLANKASVVKQNEPIKKGHNDTSDKYIRWFYW